MPVYYEINPNVPYVTSEFKFTGGKLEKIELFYKIKKESENIYKGTISNNILFQSDFKRDIVNYFKGQKFLKSLDITKSYHPSDYQFPKCCWLADSILENGFDNPLSIHYNPRIKQNVVHPGQSRQYMCQLFQKEKIDCLYFNTGGVKFSWMKDFVPVVKEELLKINFHLFSLTADHGSMIPHIYFGDQKDTYRKVFEYHDLVKSRLSDTRFRINSNILINPLSPWTTSDTNAHIEIYIKDVNNDNDVVKACILSVLGKPYRSDTLEIKINPL